MKKLAVALTIFLIVLVILFYGFHKLSNTDEVSLPSPIPEPITTETPEPIIEPPPVPAIQTPVESPTLPMETATAEPTRPQKIKPKKEAKAPLQRDHILDMADALATKPPIKNEKTMLRVVTNMDDLLQNSIKIDLKNNEDDHTVTLTGLWRGEIKMNKAVSYLLIINRPWDYMTDEYLASSCVGVEEGGKSIYQKSLYNALKFYEIKSRIHDKDVFSLVCITGDKYVVNVAIPATEDTLVTNGYAYYKQGKKLRYLGEVVLTKDTEYPKSECTDFEYKW